jgi:tetratricopeptide (TPR) repeat protein
VDLSLPPFPLLSGSEEDNQQEKVPDTPFPNATHLIQATGKPQPDSTFIPTLIATPVKPTRVPTVAVAQTAALEQEASLAQALAQKAQEQAEQQEAVRHAPTLYQQGLEQFTQGLESFDKGLFRTATKHFQEAAKAFVESGSTVQRLQVTRETKLNTQNLLTEARNQVALRAFAQADQLYLAYLEKNPQDSPTALEYGELVMDHLDYSRGAQFLAKLVSKPGLQPVQRARVHARFAEGFFRAGNITTAIQEIRAALQDDPQNQTYRSQLNQYQYANSEKQQAQQKRQGYQQRVLSDLTGSVIDSLVH